MHLEKFALFSSWAPNRSFVSPLQLLSSVISIDIGRHFFNDTVGKIWLLALLAFVYRAGVDGLQSHFLDKTSLVTFFVLGHDIRRFKKMGRVVGVADCQ
jgi:hypothetical protein